MKIHFDNINFDSNTGPNTFAKRLAMGIFESGHEIVLNGYNADISLVFIERSGCKIANKVVQRLDGIWFKPDEFYIKNNKIKDLYNTSNAVIWQSEFDKNFIINWWGDHKCGKIIRNGIDIKPVQHIDIPALISLRKEYDKIYVCSANWHKQKRLRSNIELFNKLRNESLNENINSCLIVLGNNPDVLISSPHIFYAGSLEHNTCLQIYSICDWMLHLAWADHCPNVVIEALSQGTPIVCSNVGGTKELIGDYGVILNETIHYNNELYDYDNPPELDLTQITKLPSRHELNYSTICDININNVVKSYIELFKKVLHE